MSRMGKSMRVGLLAAGIAGIVFFSLPLAHAQTPITSLSQEEIEKGAVIFYPSYKKTERWTYKCKSGDTCNDLKGKRIEIKVGESATPLFVKAAGKIPIVGIAAGASALNYIISYKETKNYQPWYAADKGGYGISSCVKEQSYITYQNPFKLGRFLKSEGAIKESCKGIRGYDKGTQPTSGPPDIEVRPYVSKGDVTASASSEGMTTKYAVNEQSHAILTLTLREAATIQPSTLKEIAKELPKEAIKGAIEEGIEKGIDAATGGVGSMALNSIGLLEPVTGKIQDVIFRDNPVWNVPLSVRVFEVIPAPDPSSFEEKPVPCASVRVAGRNVDANCRVTLPISKKERSKDVTPSAPVKYFRYEIDLGGPVVKRAEAPRPSLFASFFKFLGWEYAYAAGDDGTVRFDENGFLVVEGWDQEDLPLEQSPLSPLIQELRRQVEALREMRDALKLQLEGIRKQRGYSPSPTEKINAAPPSAPYAAERKRLHLGDISEALSRELETLLKIR